MPMASTCSQESTTSSSQDGSSSSAAIYVDEQEEPPHPSTYLHSHRPPEINKSNNSLITNTQNNSLDAPHTNAHPTHHHNSQPQPPPLSQPQQPQRTRSGSASYTLHHHPRSSSSSSFSINVDDGNAAQPYTQTSSKPMRSYSNTKTSIFSDDYTQYLANYKLFTNLCSPQEYYAQIQLGQLPFINSKKTKDRRSDCPSDISSIDSRRRKKNKASKMRQLLAWMKYVNSVLCSLLKLSFDLLIAACNKVQKWQKELQEAPLEVKEKYFFVISTLISTVLFYILFLCLDFMIKHWFALPPLITEYSFPISYCISYLTSVVWQHFFNQYFVFALKASADFDHLNSINNNNDNFCPSLIRTYIVYGFSLCCTGIIGSVLQSYTGIADEFVFFLTLPTSGCINYYLLRYCHSKHNASHSGIEYQYHAVPSNEESKYYHSKPRHHHHREHHGHHKEKYSRSSSNILFPTHHAGKLNKHHHHKLVANKPHKSHSHKTSKHHTHNKHSQAMDDIVIV